MSNKSVKIKSSWVRIKWGLFLKEQTCIGKQKGSYFKYQQNQVMEKPWEKKQAWCERII